MPNRETILNVMDEPQNGLFSQWVYFEKSSKHCGWSREPKISASLLTIGVQNFENNTCIEILKKLGRVSFVFEALPKNKQRKKKKKNMHTINFKTDSQPSLITQLIINQFQDTSFLIKKINPNKLPYVYLVGQNFGVS